MRLLAPVALLLALAAAPLGSLPAREKCCPMAGTGTTGMACCEIDSSSGSSCQIRRCGPGSTTFLVAVSSRADRSPSAAELPEPAPARPALVRASSLPTLALPSPPVPPPRD